MMDLTSEREIWIRQRKELAELLGFETRNKYEIFNQRQQSIGFVAEQGRSALDHLGRHFLGHWRSFELHMFNSSREKLGHAFHPFRWFFQRLEVYNHRGQKIGALQQRFSIFYKRFDLEDARGLVVLHVNSPFWRIWTFIFKNKMGRENARIEKKWTGMLKEVFTDADNFKLSFHSQELSNETKNVLLAATVFIDIQYFEKRARD